MPPLQIGIQLRSCVVEQWLHVSIISRKLSGNSRFLGTAHFYPALSPPALSLSSHPRDGLTHPRTHWQVTTCPQSPSFAAERRRTGRARRRRRACTDAFLKARSFPAGRSSRRPAKIDRQGRGPRRGRRARPPAKGAQAPPHICMPVCAHATDDRP